MKTTMKRFASVLLAISMIIVFSSSVIVGAVEDIAATDTAEYYIEYDYVNQTYNRIPIDSIPDYAEMTTNTYELSGMASELPRLLAINEALTADTGISTFSNIDDDGYTITSPTTDPYSGVVLILSKVTYTNGTETQEEWMRGTGFMVAPDVMVTAGHNIVQYKDGEFASMEVRIYYTYNIGTTNPVNTTTDYILPLMWTCYDYSDAMIETNGNDGVQASLQSDWCVVQLQEPITNVYNFSCEMGVSTSIFTTYCVSGYPYCIAPTCTDNNCLNNANLNHIESFIQCTSEGKIRKKNNYMAFFTNNTRKGMSGGPVYKKSNYVCYAIDTCEDPENVFGSEYEGYNGGTIINDKIYNAIAYYIER